MTTKVSNPAPLGLMGFGMTTILLNLHNFGLFPMSSVILAMGIFYGGLAQVIAGIMEYKNGNTFGTTSFTSYGMFWLSLVGLLILPEMGIAEPTSANFLASYLLIWGIFTGFLFIATLARYPRAKQIVFGSLTLLFFLLAIGDFSGSVFVKHTAGIVGIFCGSSAIYLAVAIVINTEFGRTVMPIGELKKTATAADMKAAA